MQRDKERFVRTYPQYGYGRSSSNSSKNSNSSSDELEIDRMRTEEFAHMRGSVYLDHAGATMYSSAQLQRVFAELSAGMFTNPHSAATAASAPHASSTHIERVRHQTMQFLGASTREYELVFTSGATAALKLVGECFPWQRGESCFAYAVDSHTSVLGIRGYAAAHGASTHCVSLDAMQQLATDSPDTPVPSTDDGEGDADSGAPLSLFAFPAECNFSGTRHPLTLVQRVQRSGATATARPHNWFVLLDAAKYVSTYRLDVSQSLPDFVALSFYKLFGYPTGLGALLVRRRALPLLHKVYYGGGAVQSILATQHVVVPRGLSVHGNGDGDGKADRKDDSSSSSAARLTDGTQSFLAILALRHGLELLERIGMERIEAHTAALTQLLATQLMALQHWNGRAACELYGRHWHSLSLSSSSSSLSSQTTGYGAVVACNFRRADGGYVGYTEVHKLAAIHSIELRTGCLCNPGACQTYLNRSDSDVLAAIDAGHVCGGDMDLLDGQPTGAVRLSLGYMSTYEDVAAFVTFARMFFVSARSPTTATATTVTTTGSAGASTGRGAVTVPRVRLCKIALFPIKSCSAQSVEAWPVGTRGLLFDREWAIVDAATRKALTLKDAPQLCFVHPRVDLTQQTLTIAFTPNGGAACDDDDDAFVLPLSQALDARAKDSEQGAVRDMRVCTGACKGRDERDDVSQWLSERLHRACALVRVAPSHLRDSQATASKRANMSPPTSSDHGATDDAAHRSSKIGFANQAQFLLVSRASVAHLNTALKAAGAALEVDEDAFRANLVVDGCNAFAEDMWTQLRIRDEDGGDECDRSDGVAFDVSGPCSRCSMINVDPKTGAFDRAPLQTLSRYRRERSSIFFGQFLTRRGDGEGDGISSGASAASASVSSLRWLHVHDPVEVK